MGLRSKDIINDNRYWHPHDVIAGLRVKNGAVDTFREYKIAISPIKCPDSVHSTFKFDWNRTWMFRLLEFCDTISYCDANLSSEFRTIKSCIIKDMREEHEILGEFWTDLGILYFWSFSTLTTRADYKNNVYHRISPRKDR